MLAAFNRAAEMFGIPNPIKGLKKPKSEPRLASFTPEEEKALYGATEPCFENFLFAALHTGLRPFCELAKLTADDVEESERGMMWRIYSSKTKKTRKIPVRPEVAELTRKLMKTAPRGSGKPIFRNTKGNPWKRMTGVVRFIALKEKLGWDQDPVKGKYSSYTCRHTFAHRMLSGYWTKTTVRFAARTASTSRNWRWLASRLSATGVRQSRPKAKIRGWWPKFALDTSSTVSNVPQMELSARNTGMKLPAI